MKSKEIYLPNNTMMILMLSQRRTLVMVGEVMDARIDMIK